MTRVLVLVPFLALLATGCGGATVVDDGSSPDSIRDTTQEADVPADTSTDGPACPGGQTECGTSCVNLKTDPNNCGECGNPCEGGTVCSGGECQVGCQGNLMACGASCVDFQTDREHCGSCDRACKDGEVCSAGGCAPSCQQGLVECKGLCINPQTDRDHCGAGSDCQGDNSGAACASGELCSAGTCATSCQQGLLECSGLCINPDTDRAFCGASGDCQGTSVGTACEPGEVCSDGQCALSCQAGLLNCKGTCVNPQSDRSFCGASGACTGKTTGTVCDRGEVCSNGVCLTKCQNGLIDCGGTCINPETDRTFCGASSDCSGGNTGTECEDGEVCSGGECGLSCQQGLLDCGGTCVNPRTDRGFCGASGKCTGTTSGVLCNAGEVCTDGFCASSCHSGQITCGNACVNPLTDRTFCGATLDCEGDNAGTVCPAGMVCTGGQCAVSCLAGQISCDGTCIDPRTDRAFCGASDTCTGKDRGGACSAGEVCASGRCGLSCQEGLLNCNGTCIDPRTDRSFCGAVLDCQGKNDGNVCADGQVCSGGQCGLTCQQGLVNCNGTCINPRSDRTFCGVDSACTGGDGQCADGEVCNNGTCGLSCQSGLVNCNGTCINPLTDRNFCGVDPACANGDGPCAAGQVCNNGTCGLSCQEGLVNCNSTCVDPLSSRDFCGVDDTCQNGDGPCAAGEVCNGGTCGLSCQEGLVNCNGTCINPLTDRDFCGVDTDCTGGDGICADGEVCNGGNCGLSCQQGLVNCNGTCINPDTDRQFCGVDDSCQGGDGACPDGEVCSGGGCDVSCQGGMVNCGGVCVDPANDRQFCGVDADCAGGKVCTGGEICSRRQCVVSCQDGLVNCNGTCINPLTDRAFCGVDSACDFPAGKAPCADGQVCNGGSCAVSCQAGLSNCDGTCTNTAFDPNNCSTNGSCGNVCPVPPNAVPVCINGQCNSVCQANFDNCTSAPGCETDTRSDDQHCGGCNLPCGQNMRCRNSTCVVAFCETFNLEGGVFTCPSGATEYCSSTPLNPQSSDQAREACETCYGQACVLQDGDCAGSGWVAPGVAGQFTAGHFGFSDGCSGNAGRIWGHGFSFETYGRWFGNGKALSFDGVDDLVNVSNPVAGDFTLEAWISTTTAGETGSFSSGRGIMCADAGGEQNDYGAAIVGDKFGFGIGNPDTTITSTTSVTTGQFIHVAAVREQASGTIRLFVNGVEEASASGLNTAALNAAGQLTLGANLATGRFFQGAIDEVRIWSVARTGAQIAATMNARLRGNEAGLQAYYRFEEGNPNAFNIAYDERQSFFGSYSGGPVYVESPVR